MALNISLLFVPWPIFLIALIVVVSLIIVLTAMEMNLGKKAKEKKIAQETYYQRKLSTAIALKSDSNSFLIALDKVAREFFSEEAGRTTMGRYNELASTLREQNKLAESDFCQMMQEALYSGQKLDQSKLIYLYERMKQFVVQKEGEKLNLEFGVNQTQVNPISNVQGQQLNEHILSYMKNGLQRGFELELMKQNLIQAGFDKAEVERAYSYLQKEHTIKYHAEKKILTNFFNPKQKDLELIKKGIEDKDEISRPEIIEVIPFKKEEIQKGDVKYPEKEPENYKYVNSFDDLRRVENKIQKRKEELSSQGYKGASKLG